MFWIFKARAWFRLGSKGNRAVGRSVATLQWNCRQDSPTTIQYIYFVKEYYSQQSFGMRAKFIASSCDGLMGSQGVRAIKEYKQARDYIADLQDLWLSLHGEVCPSTAVIVYRVFDKLEDIGNPIRPSIHSSQYRLSSLSFSTRWCLQVNIRDRCLDRRRDGVSSPPIPVMWKNNLSRYPIRLHGLQSLGPPYCCDYKSGASLNCSSLSSTNLADRDPQRKQCWWDSWIPECKPFVAIRWTPPSQV